MKSSTDHASGLTAQFVLCALAVVSLLYIPLPVLPQVAQAYGLAAQSAGYALTAFGFAYAAGFLVFGPLSDRIGRKRVMVGGLLALSAVTLAFTVVEGPAAFLAARALQGFAAASFPPVALAYLAERGTPRQRVWGVAWMSTAFLSAGLLGQVYGGAVAARWGFGLALTPLCAVYGLTALRVWAAPAEPRRSHRPGSMWEGYRPLPGLLLQPQLQRVYGPALLLLMGFVAFYLGVDRYLGAALASLGLDRLAVRELAMPAFLAPLAVATLIPRWGAARVAGLGLGITALGLWAAALAGDRYPQGLLGASVVFVAGIGISVPGLIARIAGTVDATARGLAVALYTFVLFVGASLGPWLAQQAGSLSVQGYFTLLAALMSAAALFSQSKARPVHAGHGRGHGHHGHHGSHAPARADHVYQPGPSGPETAEASLPHPQQSAPSAR